MLKCKTIYMKIVNKSKDLASLHLAIGVSQNIRSQ